MESTRRMGRIVFCVLLLLGSAVRSDAAHPYARETGLSSYLRGHAELVEAAAAMVQAQAAMIKAQSEANLANAKAIETLEKTRTTALDNNLKAASTFYEKRALHEGYRAIQKQRERPTVQDCVRYSKMESPQRPESYQLEPVRGTIQWHPVFMQEAFLEERVELDSLFAQRSRSAGTAQVPIYGKVQSLVGAMREDLKGMIREMSSAEYLEARKFLDSLAYESQFSPRPQGVASR